MSDPTRESSERVGAGVRCDVCGYELRGLAVSGVCPECGEAVEMSLRPERSLRFTDRAWLQTNLQAVSMLAWGARGIAASGIAMVIFVCAVGSSAVLGPSGVVAGAAILIGMLASFVMQGVGSWLLGKLPASGRAPTMRARGWVRWAGPTLIVIPCVWMGSMYLPGSRAVSADSALIAVMLMAVCLVGVGAGYLFALSYTLEGLQRRTADWKPEAREWYPKYRRNMKVFASIAGGLILIGVIGKNPGQLIGTSALFSLVIVIELISLETAMGRVAEATRLELAVAEERAREGS